MDVDSGAAGLGGLPALGNGEDEGGEVDAFDDPNLEPAVLAARQAARLAAARRREETRRQLAVMQNPQHLLRAVTATAGQGPAAVRKPQPVGSPHALATRRPPWGDTLPRV